MIINKSILITGGCGFIGSHLLEKLCNLGIKYIRVVDNLSTGKMENIKPFLDKPNVEFMWGDITNLEICRKAMKDIDLVLHQAAVGSVPRSIDDPLTTHNSNVNGFLNILIACKENNIKRLVFASSSSVYGDNEDLPKVVSNEGKCLSPYAVSKLVDELYANVFYKCYKLESIGLRYFNVFGPRQNPNGQYAAVIPKFISAAINGKPLKINGDGKISRDFTHIDNVVLANILALLTENTMCFGNVYNVGCNKSYSLNELVSTLEMILGKKLKVEYQKERLGDVKHSLGCIKHTKKDLNYEVVTDFKTGLKNTVLNNIDIKELTQ